jgi:hypothetical protein
MGLLDQGQQAAQGGAPMPAAPAAAAGAPPPGAGGEPPPGNAGALPPAAGAAPPAAAGAPAGAAPAAAPAGASGAPMKGGKATGEGVEIAEEQATPEEQQEYERAMKAVSDVLYSNEKLSNSIVDQINPENMVDSTAKVSMLLIQQLDEKVDFAEVVVAQVTQEIVSRIIELAEARHQIEYGEDEMQVILSATFEGVGEMFGGMDEQSMQELTTSVGHENMQGLKQNHEAALRG